MISRETAKLLILKSKHSEEKEKTHHENKVKERAPFYHNKPYNNERQEHFEFMLELEREAEEKHSLLQDAVREAALSGFPFPPSFVKLMHSHNGK